MILRLEFSVGIKEARELVEEIRQNSLRADFAEAEWKEAFPRLSNLMTRLESPLTYLEGEKIPGNPRSDLAPEEPAA